MSTDATCNKCGVTLPKTAPRLVVNGWWLCPDCAYWAEHGESERRKAHREVRSKHPQTETLFPT